MRTLRFVMTCAFTILLFVCRSISKQSELTTLKLQSYILPQSLFSIKEVSALSTSTSSYEKMKIIDSHLHIWANPKEATTYPYFPSQEPPDNLSEVGSKDALIQKMKDANVNGCLIVQPINHKYDHSYVRDAIKSHPSLFKGMLLHDPSLPLKEALEQLEDLSKLGFVGVRYNPYLWPNGEQMSNDVGLKVFQRCGELNMPVGIMCFKGLDLHLEDIKVLLEKSPDTKVILDHFGFTLVDDEKGDANFENLLKLQKYPNVYIKISALFRVAPSSVSPKYPYEAVKTKRFLPLLNAFGANRLMFGTDFPFVLETENGYKGAVDVVKSWMEKEEEKVMVMGGTAEHLFGVWGNSGSSTIMSGE